MNMIEIHNISVKLHTSFRQKVTRIWKHPERTKSNNSHGLLNQRAESRELNQLRSRQIQPVRHPQIYKIKSDETQHKAMTIATPRRSEAARLQAPSSR